MKRNVGPFVLALCLLITPAEDENHSLICNEPLSKEVGDNVTLECHHATGLDVTNQSVYWQFNSSIHVLVFKSGGFSPDDQGEQFKGRASEDSSWNPAEGKLSVKISSIERADAGTYTCSVGKKKMSCSTELSIGALDGARSPDPDDPGHHLKNKGNPANNTGLTSGGMGVFCLFIGIGFVIFGVMIICSIAPIRDCKRRIIGFMSRILESFTNRHRD
uniref:uncharacterized protein LOC120822841 isoform X2 n=1 Tax=Gasterosteus aculeatus aculeatus TaxID=481459 RepID=UPI001A990CAA|nr:uncharacterized protein LOC120822841 isoform X2 [Gasterosteus aculeatus aculeatus]